MKKLVVLLVLFVSVFTLSGCANPFGTSSDRVSQNLSRQADEFRVLRRIAFINGITNEPMLEMIGYCSIEADQADNQLEVTCKIGEEEYEKHFLGLSDNTTYIVEQLETLDVPQYHYQVIFTPQALLPIPEIVGGRLGE